MTFHCFWSFFSFISICLAWINLNDIQIVIIQKKHMRWLTTIFKETMTNSDRWLVYPAHSYIPPYHEYPRNSSHIPWPICSMYRIVNYIWDFYGVNVAKYSIHGAYSIFSKRGLRNEKTRVSPSASQASINLIPAHSVPPVRRPAQKVFTKDSNSQRLRNDGNGKLMYCKWTISNSKSKND